MFVNSFMPSGNWQKFNTTAFNNNLSNTFNQVRQVETVPTIGSFLTRSMQTLPAYLNQSFQANYITQQLYNSTSVVDASGTSRNTTAVFGGSDSTLHYTGTNQGMNFQFVHLDNSAGTLAGGTGVNDFLVINRQTAPNFQISGYENVFFFG